MAKEIKIEKLSGENEMDLEEGSYVIYGAEEDSQIAREQEEKWKMEEERPKAKCILKEYAEDKKREEIKHKMEKGLLSDEEEKVIIKRLHLDEPEQKEEYVAPECKIDEKCAVPGDFDGICHDLMVLHARKNKDYQTYTVKYFGGDDEDEEREEKYLQVRDDNMLSNKEFGLISYVIRLNDKMKRLKSLTKPGTEISVKGESIEDTLMDLAAYAIMAIESLRNE